MPSDLRICHHDSIRVKLHHASFLIHHNCHASHLSLMCDWLDPVLLLCLCLPACCLSFHQHHLHTHMCIHSVRVCLDLPSACVWIWHYLLWSCSDRTLFTTNPLHINMYAGHGPASCFLHSPPLSCIQLLTRCTFCSLHSLFKYTHTHTHTHSTV